MRVTASSTSYQRFTKSGLEENPGRQGSRKLRAMGSEKYSYEDILQKVREYARSKKLDKGASSGKPGVDIGAVAQEGGEEWGTPYEGGWEEINSVDQRKGLKGKGKGKGGKSKGKGKSKGGAKGKGGGKGSGKSTEVVTDGKGNRYPSGGASFVAESIS